MMGGSHPDAPPPPHRAPALGQTRRTRCLFDAPQATPRTEREPPAAAPRKKPLT